MRRLLLLLILLIAFTSASWEFAARRFNAQDVFTTRVWGTITGLLYAGHDHRPLNVKVLWTTPNTHNATLQLINDDWRTFGQEVPDDWYDGASTLSLERLLVRARGETTLLHVTQTRLTNDSISTLSVAPNSAVWDKFAQVDYTGTSIRLLSRYSPTDRRKNYAWSPGPSTYQWVHNGTQVVISTSIDPDEHFTYLPEKYHLDRHFGLKFLIPGKQESVLIPTEDAEVTHYNGTTIVLGRRFLAAYAAAWTLNATGHYTVDWRAPMSLALDIFLFLLGAALCWGLTFWFSAVGSRQDIASALTETNRPLRQSLFILLLASISLGTVLPASRFHTTEIHTLAKVQTGILAVMVAALAISTVFVGLRKKRSAWALNLWTSLHVTTASRALLLVLTPGASEWFLPLAILLVFYLTLAVYMSLSDFIYTLTHVVEHRTKPWWYVAFVLEGVLAGWDLYAAVVLIIVPAATITNIYYSPRIATGFGLFLLSAIIVPATVGQAMRFLGRKMN